MTPSNLKKTLKTLNMAPVELATATGVNRSTISRYLSGELKIPQKFSILINLMVAQRNGL